MMKIRIPESFLQSQRSISEESFPPYRRDHLDIYRYDSCVMDPVTFERVATYVIMQANCNPDFDW